MHRSTPGGQEIRNNLGFLLKNHDLCFEGCGCVKALSSFQLQKQHATS